jgi:UDP-N-acetylmuramoyl-L-alanyl-D-glutamate--2,6-diaminopimelate ligase
MVAKQIADFEGKIDAMVIEVSEVQGWLENLMKDHAYLMTSAIDPDVVIITNVALDHIGLVNSIEETFEETSGAVKALKKENGTLILNYDDQLVRKMRDYNPHKKTLFFGDDAYIKYKEDGIICNEHIILKTEELPFKSHHFIENTMAAIGAAFALNIDNNIIKKSISKYRPLSRRFSIISKEPCIIDDFAHNPDGIEATIKNAALNVQGDFYIVTAIRGSRGEAINRSNAEVIGKELQNKPYKLIVTNSNDVVDDLNVVNPLEKKVFIDALGKREIKYIFYEKLYDALKYVLKRSNKEDTILLIGAQGMDPASELLEKILKTKDN